MPKTLSSKKIKATSCAGANLGEMVIIINGIGNNIKHIIKIETKTETSSSVTDTNRKTSGYEVIVAFNVFLYKREAKYDRRVYSFEEREITMFELSPNQVLSTLASRNKAFKISSENISKRILDRIMLYFVKDNSVNK